MESNCDLSRERVLASLIASPPAVATYFRIFNTFSNARCVSVHDGLQLFSVSVLAHKKLLLVRFFFRTIAETLPRVFLGVVALMFG